MTFAAEFLGVVGMCVFATLIFLIVAAWRKDREDRRERLSNCEGAAGQSSLAPEEWDPLANLFEDAAPRRDWWGRHINRESGLRRGTTGRIRWSVIRLWWSARS